MRQFRVLLTLFLLVVFVTPVAPGRTQTVPQEGSVPEERVGGRLITPQQPPERRLPSEEVEAEVTTPQGEGGLPVTGAHLALFALIGVLAVVSGEVIRRKARSKRARSDEPSDAAPEARDDYGVVGREISLLLSTAQQSAERIRREAEKEAEELRREAELEAGRVRDSAEQQAKDRLELLSQREAALRAAEEELKQRLFSFEEMLHQMRARLDVSAPSVGPEEPAPAPGAQDNVVQMAEPAEPAPAEARPTPAEAHRS